MARDRIVVGLKDKTLSEKLQLGADLSLERAINQARQKELVRKQQEINRQEGTSSSSNVDRVKSNRPRPKDKFKTSNEVEDRNQTCGRCGGKRHERNECPAKKFISNSCKMIKSSFFKNSYSSVGLG